MRLIKSKVKFVGSVYEELKEIGEISLFAPVNDKDDTDYEPARS